MQQMSAKRRPHYLRLPPASPSHTNGRRKQLLPLQQILSTCTALPAEQASKVDQALGCGWPGSLRDGARTAHHADEPEGKQEGGKVSQERVGGGLQPPE